MWDIYILHILCILLHSPIFIPHIITYYYHIGGNIAILLIFTYYLYHISPYVSYPTLLYDILFTIYHHITIFTILLIFTKYLLCKKNIIDIYYWYEHLIFTILIIWIICQELLMSSSRTSEVRLKLRSVSSVSKASRSVTLKSVWNAWCNWEFNKIYG